MVAWNLPKVHARVRFSHPALSYFRFISFHRKPDSVNRSHRSPPRHRRSFELRGKVAGLRIDRLGDPDIRLRSRFGSTGPVPRGRTIAGIQTPIAVPLLLLACSSGIVRNPLWLIDFWPPESGPETSCNFERVRRPILACSARSFHASTADRSIS